MLESVRVPQRRTRSAALSLVSTARSTMQKQELKYEGKAKRVYATDQSNLNIIEFKDDATAFNARKRGTIAGKGAMNNAISCRLYPLLEQQGIPTHFVERIDAVQQLVHDVTIIPVEVI